MRSQNIQNTAPITNAPGITTMGLDVPSAPLIRNGTAIPTKEIGPAKAVTVAENTLERRISTILNTRMFTPILRA